MARQRPAPAAVVIVVDLLDEDPGAAVATTFAQSRDRPFVQRRQRAHLAARQHAGADAPRLVVAAHDQSRAWPNVRGPWARGELLAVRARLLLRSGGGGRGRSPAGNHEDEPEKAGHGEALEPWATHARYNAAPPRWLSASEPFGPVVRRRHRLGLLRLGAVGDDDLLALAEHDPRRIGLRRGLPSTHTLSCLGPFSHRLPMHDALSGRPHTAKNWPRVNWAWVGDSTWMIPGG